MIWNHRTHKKIEIKKDKIGKVQSIRMEKVEHPMQDITDEELHAFADAVDVIKAKEKETQEKQEKQETQEKQEKQEKQETQEKQEWNLASLPPKEVYAMIDMVCKQMQTNANANANASYINTIQ